MPVKVTHERFVAKITHLDGSIRPEREDARMRMNRQIFASAKSAPDAGNVHSDGGGREVKARRQLREVLMRTLRRNVEINSAFAIRDCQSRFRPEKGLILRAYFIGTFNDDIALRGAVATAYHNPTKQVAIRMDRRCRFSRLGVRHRLKRLIVDLDRSKGAPTGMKINRSNDCDRITFKAHDIGSEHRLISMDETVARFARQIL
jgi:hypothetical protein